MTSTSSKLQEFEDKDNDDNNNADTHQDVSLAQLLRRTLASSEAFLQSPPSTQFANSQIPSASASTSASLNMPTTPSLATLLSNLSLCASLIAHLGLVSPNETLSDLSTRTLPCLLVPYYRGLLDLQSRTRDYNGRKEVLKRAKTSLESFRTTCDAYGVVDSEKRKQLAILSENGRGAPNDPMSRRDAKIRQYKEEKALREKLELLEQRRSDRIRVVGQSKSAPRASQDDDEDEDDDTDDSSGGTSLRTLYLTRISLCYMRTHSELSSIGQELELLNNMPHNMSELPPHRSSSSSSAASGDDRQRAREKQDETWRLDKVAQSLTAPSGGAHTLLDTSGRPMRPFTILPSSSSSSSSNAGSIDTRLRLQNQVFGPGHRLPTMGIDEYLELEKERGNVLQGGGAANKAAVDKEKNDKKAWEEEEDNLNGEQRAEAKRVEQQGWDEYRDSHKRGDGNRINQG